MSRKRCGPNTRPLEDQPMKNVDPWVALFLKTDPEPENLIRTLRAAPQPLPAKVEAVGILLEVTLGVRPKERLQQVDWAYDEPASVDQHLLFLITWFRALFFVEPDWPRMRILRDRIMALVSPSTPPEITGWARLMHGLTQFYSGDTRSYLAAVGQVTDGIAPNSPHQLRLALIRVITYLQQGMGAIAEYPKAPAAVGEVFRLRLRNLRVANAALTGDLESVTPEEIEPSSGAPNARALLWPTEYEVACQTLRLMGEASPSGARRALAARAAEVLPAEEPAWSRSARCLLEGRVERALELARAHHGRRPSTRRTVVGFDEYALIRAELASGRAAAALGLLQAREERGSWHYIDDLFLARANLLAGKREQSARHFARLLPAIDKFKAQGRLDFELRLASELSAGDLLSLTRQAERAGPGAAARDQPVAVHGPRQPSPTGLDRLVHVSQSMRSVCDLVSSFASSELPLLITGETGTGKELVARALHEAGPQRDARFTAINCAALSDTLVESELFGHARGAFTGAQREHHGLFRDAGVGTVLLDEIGDISPRLQATLLRVLETGEVRPVGSSKTFAIRCRILAATNADLQALVEQGRFRRDLLFRLFRLHVHIPALRERPEDITALASHFLDVGRPAGARASMSDALKGYLRAHPWSGNVRELRNALERMRVLNSDKLSYDASDLDAAVLGGPGSAVYPAISALGVAGDGVTDPPTAEPLTPAPVELPQAQPPQSVEEAKIANLLGSSRSPLRRLDRIRTLFERLPKLQAVELAGLMETSRHTAARDLRRLCEEGFIRKVCPTASPRTHYYERVAPKE